jgi:hypothetical protein
VLKGTTGPVNGVDHRFRVRRHAKLMAGRCAAAVEELFLDRYMSAHYNSAKSARI